MPGRSRNPATADRILEVAERLVQTRGFNGFSYADISAEVGITKASLHYHFPAKADLGAALVARYGSAFFAALEAIEARATDAPGLLRGYARLYADVLRRDRMCLCGMLAAEERTLPGAMQDGVRDFFARNEAWLARVLEDGRRAGALRFAGPATEAAGTLLGALEGAMLIARSYREPSRFESAAWRLLGDLGVTADTG